MSSRLLSIQPCAVATFMHSGNSPYFKPEKRFGLLEHFLEVREPLHKLFQLARHPHVNRIRTLLAMQINGHATKNPPDQLKDP